jgi:hypothetical protein
VDKEVRGTRGIVHSAIDVKTWIARPPSADEARPSQCPHCHAASRPAGRGLGLWGHGRRDRQQRGLQERTGTPTIVVVVTRRYRCRGCGALIGVVPRGVVFRRHFSAGTIALAVFLFSLGRRSGEVRGRCNPWRIKGTSAKGWPQLLRWISAVQEGALFPAIKPLLIIGELHDRKLAAARAAMALSAKAPVGRWTPGAGAMEEQVFLGAAHMI